MTGQELHLLLGSVCAQAAPVTIVSVDSANLARGRFRTVSQESITVELIERPPHMVFKPLSRLVLVFRQGNLSYVFLALVKEYHGRAFPVIRWCWEDLKK